MEIREAVGLAHQPGRNTIRGDISRAFQRAWFWLLVRPWVPDRVKIPALRLVTRAANFALGGWAVLSGASKGDTFENDLLKLIFNATAIANIADNAASAPLTNLYASLHTGDPGEAGNQQSSEIAYTGYARVAVARTTGGWTVTGNSVSPVANIDFGEMTGGAGGTATHFVIGTLSGGTGKILYYGTLTPNISVVNGVIPRIKTTSTITEG